jgi:hypothetical protein
MASLAQERQRLNLVLVEHVSLVLLFKVEKFTLVRSVAKHVRNGIVCCHGQPLSRWSICCKIMCTSNRELHVTFITRSPDKVTATQLRETRTGSPLDGALDTPAGPAILHQLEQRRSETS